MFLHKPRLFRRPCPQSCVRKRLSSFVRLPGLSPTSVEHRPACCALDPEPVLAKLAERKQRHDLEIRQFQEIERWRDRLLSEPKAALEELLKEYPNADRAVLAKLLEKAEKERVEQRSPVGARELFAFLRQLLA